MPKILLFAASFLVVLECFGQDVHLVQLTEGEGDHRYPAWSPEPGMLAFESTRDGNWELYLINVEDRSVARLTNNPADDRYPAWDAIGSRLVFQSTRTGSPELHLFDLTTRKTSLLMALEGDETFPDWSRDGTKIAFSLKTDSVSQIAVMSIDGKREVLAPSRYDSFWPRWSPDSGKLVFSSSRDTKGTDDEIYLLNYNESVIRRVTDRAGHDITPIWSPSGDRIAAISVEPDGSRSLRLMPLDGGPHHVLRTPFSDLTEPSWSPDGQFIAVAARMKASDPYHVFLLSVDR